MGLDLTSARCVWQFSTGFDPVRPTLGGRARSGFGAGGDDYLTKPSGSPGITGEAEKSSGAGPRFHKMNSVRLQAADLQLDLARREARRGDHLPCN